MALKHNLALEIPTTGCKTVIKVLDYSVYNDSIPKECMRFAVWVPGSTTPVYIEVEDTFNKNISAIDLEYQTDDSDLMELVDGLYVIEASMAPNDKVKVTYYHLRITNTLTKYYEQLCRIRLSDCQPTAEVNQQLKDLKLIKSYIDAAKAKAEYCHSPNQAIKMLTYAIDLLDKYESGCCLTCG
jgi:hypothetical protein